MGTDIERAGNEGLPAPVPKVTPFDLYAALIAHASKPTTRRARQQDAIDFAKFMNLEGNEEGAKLACAGLIAHGVAEANIIALAYKTHLAERGLSAATRNRRLSTVRTIVRLARRIGLVGWSIEIESLRVTPYRDTTGPGYANWLRLHGTAEKLAKRDAKGKGKRDLAMILLLRDHGLRREEVVSLDTNHWEPDRGKLWILGKGYQERIPITINPPTIIAIEQWLDVRGREPGPLFVRVGNCPLSRLQRLDGDGVLWIVGDLAKKAGIKGRVRPHGLRHEAITRVLHLTQGNLDAGQKFGRQKDANTTQRYNDARTDVLGEMARLLGGERQ